MNSSILSQYNIPVQAAVPFVIFFIGGIILGITKAIIRNRVERKNDAWYAVAGLREYIIVAEKDRLKFRNDPDQSLKIYSTLFPYAMAFGLEDKWTKIFDGIITTPPTWYHGKNTSLIVFSSSMSSFSSSMGSSSRSGQPTSSGGGSGSSGGGSSGGGGGGGGGGSW